MADSPPDLSDEFFRRWVDMCKRLECDPLDPMRVAYSESNVRASAHNPHGNASGIIQFMPATLGAIGYKHGHEAFRKLSAEDQVPWTEIYFRTWSHRNGVNGRIPQLTSAGLCYVATFLPGLLTAAVAAGEGAPSFVLCGMRGPMTWAYNANKVLDRDKDGAITVADLQAHLDVQCRGARWEAIKHRLELAAGTPSEPPPEPPPTERELPPDDA